MYDILKPAFASQTTLALTPPRSNGTPSPDDLWLFTDPSAKTLYAQPKRPGMFPLPVGSSAPDIGDTAHGATTDQRGIARPQNLATDIGAYEAVLDPNIYAYITATPSGPAVTYTLVITTLVKQSNLIVTANLPVTSVLLNTNGTFYPGGDYGTGYVSMTVPSMAAGQVVTLTWDIRGRLGAIAVQGHPVAMPRPHTAAAHVLVVSGSRHVHCGPCSLGWAINT